MATEDDNFDIDIYGDDPVEAETAQAQGAYGDDYELDFSTTNDETNGREQSTSQAVAGGEQAHQEQATEFKHPESLQQPQPQQGTKRKAPPDEVYPEDGKPNYAYPEDVAYDNSTEQYSSNDPYALPALKLTELQWWTSEEDLRAFCAKAGVEDQLKELSFGEHKINGKSRGEAYLEFDSSSAAEKVKAEVDQAVAASQTESGAKRKDWFIEYSPAGNGFRMAAGTAGPKKDYQSQGAYNNRGGYNDRGSFQPRGNFRGGGGFNNRGGGFNNRGGMNQQFNSQQGGWGGGSGMMPNMGGAGFNPMMAGMMQNMGGFNNMSMGRGGGFNNMGGMNMGRGGMMGMNMGMPMGRGGWNGGFQGSQGNGMGGQQGWQGGGGMQGGNKRAKME